MLNSSSTRREWCGNYFKESGCCGRSETEQCVSSFEHWRQRHLFSPGSLT